VPVLEVILVLLVAFAAGKQSRRNALNQRSVLCDLRNDLILPSAYKRVRCNKVPFHPDKTGVNKAVETELDRRRQAGRPASAYIWRIAFAAPREGIGSWSIWDPTKSIGKWRLSRE
jgi:hypothetical protein